MQALGNELRRFGLYEDGRHREDLLYLGSTQDSDNTPIDSTVTTTVLVVVNFDTCADNVRGPFSNEEQQQIAEDLRQIGKSVREHRRKKRENEQKILSLLFSDRFDYQPRKFRVLQRRSQPKITPPRPPSFFRRVAHKHRENMTHG
jgi:hypothetical protein